MGVFKLDDCFQFDYNKFFNEEVNSVGVNLLSAIKDGHFLFAFKSEVVIGKFNFQRALVDDFLKVVAN